jgi:hypothetical protein
MEDTAPARAPCCAQPRAALNGGHGHRAGRGHIGASRRALRRIPVALAAGRALGAELPSEIVVVGIVVSSIGVFDDTLSRAAQAAVDPAVELVLERLAGHPLDG